MTPARSPRDEAGQRLSLFDRILVFFSRSQFISYSLLLHVLLIAGILSFWVPKMHTPDERMDGWETVTPEESQPDIAQVSGRIDREMQERVMPNADPRNIVGSKPNAGGLPLPPELIVSPSGGDLVAIPGNYNRDNRLPIIVDSSVKLGTRGLRDRSAIGFGDITELPSFKVAKGLQETVNSWSPVPGSKRFEFDVRLAKYATGDWDSAHTIRSNYIVKGALPNLALKLQDWSRDKVRAEIRPEPLDLASTEILEVRPAFILFTGTKDFALTDKEIENLRQYLLLGGAIWGDSSLPGKDSRFDIAFRREMLRVISNKAINWEMLSWDHPLFQIEHRFNGRTPAGLNYYAEPVYAVHVYQVPSIFYTANGYASMMEIGLDEEDRIDRSRDQENRMLYSREGLLLHSDIYYRNISDESVKEAYQFASNMALYLLNRWEETLRRHGLRR